MIPDLLPLLGDGLKLRESALYMGLKLFVGEFVRVELTGTGIAYYEYRVGHGVKVKRMAKVATTGCSQKDKPMA